jgi:hypothetical protein
MASIEYGRRIPKERRRLPGAGCEGAKSAPQGALVEARGGMIEAGQERRGIEVKGTMNLPCGIATNGRTPVVSQFENPVIKEP